MPFDSRDSISLRARIHTETQRHGEQFLLLVSWSKNGGARTLAVRARIKWLNRTTSVADSTLAKVCFNEPPRRFSPLLCFPVVDFFSTFPPSPRLCGELSLPHQPKIPLRSSYV